MDKYSEGAMVEFVREDGRDLSETFGQFLPRGHVVTLLPGGRIRVKPTARAYTMDVLPADIRPLI
jgi:hypothetical protein